MRVFKSLCRFKMCADVKDSLVAKFWLEIETSFFFPAAQGRQLSHKVNKFAPSMMEIHTCSIDLVGVESANSAIEAKDSQMKPETPNASHATPHFWREMQMKTHQARQVDLSRLRRSRSGASRPNKAGSARQEVDL